MVRRIRGDALEVLRTLPGATVDVIITDPPWPTLEAHRSVGTTTRLRKQWFNVLSFEEIAACMVGMARVLKRGGWLFMHADFWTAAGLALLDGLEPSVLEKGSGQVGSRTGLLWWSPWIWRKTNRNGKTAPGMGYHGRGGYEHILCLTKGRARLADLGVTSVVEAPVQRQKDGSRARKPPEVAEAILYAVLGDRRDVRVADFYAGCASVGEACGRLGIQDVVLVDEAWPEGTEVEELVAPPTGAEAWAVAGAGSAGVEVRPVGGVVGLDEARAVLEGERPYGLLTGHALDALRALPDGCVHCVVTSPPYFGLRRYPTDSVVWGGDPECQHEWAASAQASPPSCARCGAARCDLGLEADPSEYVRHLVEVFREVRRVLRDDGTVWVVIGDSFVRDRPGDAGLGTTRAKNLLGIPWMLAFALRDDGWYLRADALWAKANALLESVRDRPSRSTEYIFLFSKSARYFYDADAVRQPVAASGRASGNVERKTNDGARSRINDHRGSSVPWEDTGAGRQRRTGDWMFESLAEIRRANRMILGPDGLPVAFVGSLQPSKLKHHASFPEWTVWPAILASTSEAGCCSATLGPFRRVTERATRYLGTSAVAGRTREPVVSESRKSLHGPTYSRHRFSIEGGQSLSDPSPVSTGGFEAPCPAPVPRNERDGGLTVQRGMDRTGLSHFKHDEWLRENPSQTVGFEAPRGAPMRRVKVLRGEGNAPPAGGVGNDPTKRGSVLISRLFAPTCDCGAPTVPALVLDPFAGTSTTGAVALKLGRRYLGIDLSAEYNQMGRERLEKVLAETAPDGATAAQDDAAASGAASVSSGDAVSLSVAPAPLSEAEIEAIRAELRRVGTFPGSGP